MVGSVPTWKILRIFQSQFLFGEVRTKHATAHINKRCSTLKTDDKNEK